MEQLLLLQETKISEMLGGQVDPRLEASGVLAKDSVFYVIFVSWTDSNRIVVISDKTKSKQEELGREKDQSIHIFEIPGRS
jgi:hypothetical protein